MKKKASRNDIKNEIIETIVPSLINVEFLGNTKVGGKLFLKGQRAKVKDTQGLLPFIKII